MIDIEQEIQSRYLNRLDDLTWSDEDPRLVCGILALPYFTAAFQIEKSAPRRARLIRIVWHLRDPAALPTLAIALGDPSREVWQDALDGIVTLGGKAALAILNDARAVAATDRAGQEKREWIDEALAQLDSPAAPARL